VVLQGGVCSVTESTNGREAEQRLREMIVDRGSADALDPLELQASFGVIPVGVY
jgi:hypothetical protein